MPISLSAILITLNEEAHLRRCLDSLQGVVEEIVVVDSFSTDDTEAICREYGVRFYQRTFAGFGDQKNFALDQASHDHVLSLDADEALNEALRASILKVKANWTHDGYALSRLNCYCGHWVRHGAWYPDVKLRLWDRRQGRWNARAVHESVVLAAGATQEKLPGELLHYSVESVAAHLRQINFFTSIKARQAVAEGKKASLLKGVVKAGFRFFQDYVLRSGWRDGPYGFMIAWNSAYARLLEQMKILDAHRSQKPGAKPAAKP